MRKNTKKNFSHWKFAELLPSQQNWPDNKNCVTNHPDICVEADIRNLSFLSMVDFIKRHEEGARHQLPQIAKLHEIFFMMISKCTWSPIYKQSLTSFCSKGHKVKQQRDNLIYSVYTLSIHYSVVQPNGTLILLKRATASQPLSKSLKRLTNWYNSILKRI